MSDGFDIHDIHDILSGMSAQTVILQALLKANPEVAMQVRAFALDFESMSRGMPDLRSAKVVQQDLLQITKWLDT